MFANPPYHYLCVVTYRNTRAKQDHGRTRFVQLGPQCIRNPSHDQGIKLVVCPERPRGEIRAMYNRNQEKYLGTIGFHRDQQSVV